MLACEPEIKKIVGGSPIGLLLGSYIVLVPSISLIPSLGPYNEKRVLQIGLLLIGGGILLVSGTTQRWWLAVFRGFPTLAQWGFGAVLGLGVLSSILAPAPFYAFLEAGTFVLLFALAGILASEVRRNPKQTEWVILCAVALSALLYAVYFAVSYGMAVALPELDIGRETVSGFVNTRFFNQYQTWTLPLLVGLVVALPQKWRAAKGIVFFLAALWWTLVFASNVRGTILATFIGAVGVWLLFRRRAYHWLLIYAAAAVAGGGLYFLLFYLGGDVAPQVAEKVGDIGRRPQHWTKCLNMAWTHPWLGVGPMHYAWPPNDFAVAAHPHSAFLQWLAEWGLPSTTVVSGLTIWGGWSWMQRERDIVAETEDFLPAVGVPLVAAVLAGASHSMVSGLIVMPLSQILLAIVGGWALGRYRPIDRGMSTRFSCWPQGILYVVIAGSMFIVGAALQDVTTVEERREAFLEAVDRPIFSPRYWGQGYLNVQDPDVIRRADTE